VTSNRALDSIDDPRNTNARQWYTNLSALKRVGVIAVIVAGLAWALASLELFSSFGLSLLVAAGVATAVFGFAAQTVLGNIVASLQLALAKPIRIGDAVLYDDHWAYVERINYTFVQLRTWDMKRYVVPVRNFVSEAFENWTKEDPELIVPVLLKLDHRTDVEAMRRAFHDMAPRDPDWSENAAPKVEVVGHDEHGVNVRFYCTANNPTAAWNLHCRMRERLLAFLRRQDEPSDWPRLRLARVGDTTGEDVSAPAAYEDGFDEDTGEPKARPLSEARSEAAE
jgi:small-conductance mechanosensitive channel